MGNSKSVETTDVHNDIWWSNGSVENQKENLQDEAHFSTKPTQISDEREQRRKELEEDFAKFKQELARKHEKRRQLISEKRKEMADLRDELIQEREENARLKQLLRESEKTTKQSESVDQNSELLSLKEENEDLKVEVERLTILLKEKDSIADKNKELRISLADMQKELQSLNTEMIDFEKERLDYQEHVKALKDIIKVTKEMLQVREVQITELKKKISTIEELLASKEVSILSDDLRHEYERQLQNIKDLRILYEDRQRADRRDKEHLTAQVEETKKLFEDEQKKNEELQERINELETETSERYDKIINLESNLGFSNASCKELQAEMTVINQLFSQILMSFNADQDVDLDNLTRILEENHELLTNIVTNDEHNVSSSLPKVLLDLVNQVNENKKEPLEQSEDRPEAVEQHAENREKLETITEEEDTQLHQLNSPEEIVENLPKVWRVLIELLSHQSAAPNNEIDENGENGEKKGSENDHHCYKSVETPTGLRKVLSVSKTFIRLKSLILEKKSLEKDLSKLKHLNTHLEGRLQDQEKRLVLVSSELSKTWNVVGMMQKQHQQLHTQEKILRYELAQKRKLLTELKEELEYCRQKWHQAREQNTSTEQQWKELRTEFASRKRSVTDDINNSVESGYSDDKSSSDDDIPDSDAEKPEEDSPSTTNDTTEEPQQQYSILAVVQNEVDQIVNSFDDGDEDQKPTEKTEVKDTEEIQEEAQNLPIEEKEVGPSTSTPKNPVQAAEEFVARREVRMKDLEEQCSQLFSSVAKTSLRGEAMSNKLHNLHETYGGTSQEVTVEESTPAVVEETVTDVAGDESNDNTQDS